MHKRYIIGEIKPVTKCVCWLTANYLSLNVKLKDQTVTLLSHEQ